MIPRFISKNVQSHGEKIIFHMLENEEKTDDWVVLHSLNIPKHIKRYYGEIDFLILVPGLGIFCLEVKSGQLKRNDDGALFNISASTYQNKGIINVIGNVEMFVINNKMNETNPMNDKSLFYVNTSSTVCFSQNMFRLPYRIFLSMINNTLTHFYCF